MGKQKSALQKALGIAVSGIAAAVILLTGTNAAVVLSTAGNIREVDELSRYQADAIVVLGALVHPNGSPSHILQDRLDCGAALYAAGAAPKIIVSGDNGTKTYNEVEAMKRYLVDQGIPSEDIFCDHAGFSTYESMYRAKHVFGCSRIVVATQTYHLYRSLYTAQALGLEAVGSPSEARLYGGQLWFSTREAAARTKDFFKAITQPPSTFVGEPISLAQSGDATNG